MASYLHSTGLLHNANNGDHHDTPPSPDSTFTVADDGLGYEGGVRVLQSLDSWSPTIPTKPTQTHETTTYIKEPVPKIPKVNRSREHAGKPFACPVCGKGLARKDKLTIHLRIHTGEKPYVCEICFKAFARRDKLVIHMNKQKHITPTNIAPLGKRPHITPNAVKENQEDKTIKEVLPLQKPLEVFKPVNWTCELCGRTLPTREEWSSHARGHLDEKLTQAPTITNLYYHHPAGLYTPDRQICVPDVSSLSKAIADSSGLCS